MIKSILRRIHQLSRRIHVRVILIALLALLALGMAALVAPLIPERLGDLIGADAVDRILQILASSMLAVTIFSLTIMLSALSNASSQWTPRSHLILREDTVTHSVLANFLGAYLFALVAIVMRSADLFDERGIVVLFGMTLAVVASILISLIRWIVHLEGLGSLAFTTHMLEQEAAAAVARAAEAPAHGGHALTDPESQIPEGTTALCAERPGYLEQIFEDLLEAEAADKDLTVYITISPGQYVLKGACLGHVAGEVDEDALTRLREALPLSEQRSFAQDPLFGLTVLAEVATRALSPGINDPGTAIDVINRLARVIVEARIDQPEDPSCPHLWAPPLQPKALYSNSFDPISRSASDALEVQIALQRALRQIADHAQDAQVAEAALEMAAQCLDRAQQEISFEPDLARLKAACG